MPYQTKTVLSCLLNIVKVKSLSCVRLLDPMDCSLPGSSVHGFSRQEYWSGCLCLLRVDLLVVLILLPNIAYLCSAAAAKSLQSCLTLCDPMNCSLPGFSVHGILQARTLEWVRPTTRSPIQYVNKEALNKT